MKNLSGKFVQKIETHISGTIPFSFQNLDVYEIIWKNTVQPGRPHITRRCMRIECWIPKATHEKSEYIILFNFSDRLCGLVVRVSGYIQRSWVRFPALPDFLSSSGSGTGSTHPREPREVN
jgi:hypothetical protein